MTRAERIKRDVDAIIYRGVLRGAIQRRRDDPDVDHGEGDERAMDLRERRIVIFTGGHPMREPGQPRKCEMPDAIQG